MKANKRKRPLTGSIIKWAIIATILILVVGICLFFIAREKLPDYILNVLTNLMFVFFTFTVLSELSKQQQMDAEIRDLLNKIERDNGENSYDAFMEVVSAIRRGKYPADTLSDVYYPAARLANQHLESFHLEDAVLRQVDFEKASLIGIYLQNANLEGAILRDSNLTLAHLDGVNLSSSDLCGAILGHAILSHSSTQKTILKDAKFNAKTVFNSDTILPNGTRYKTDEPDKMRAYLEREAGMIWCI